ncbi:hypothetical protein N7461_007115 [Penicillium sp. DV-2018c]|nr:hypothetical protein N7461_007115 [Penicillium sp. DV-2018c]
MRNKNGEMLQMHADQLIIASIDCIGVPTAVAGDTRSPTAGVLNLVPDLVPRSSGWRWLRPQCYPAAPAPAPPRRGPITDGGAEAELATDDRSAMASGGLRSTRGEKGPAPAGDKEPDGSWIPSTPPPTEDTWPSVVAQVAYSESSRRLHLDASWWLANSQGEVKVVILIFIAQGRANITFESIINSQPIIALRNGRPRFQPVTRQKIEVSRPPGGSTMPVSCVPAEPLHVSCEELLRRAPVPPETDADIPVQSLIEVATKIWNIQYV